MYKPIQLLQIGTLVQLQYPACIPYEYLKAGLFIHDHASFAVAADIAEATALQLLTQHDSGEAQLRLFEAAASPYFVQIKRLFAVSDQQWGQQFFTASHCLKYLNELEELTHRRFALLAQTGVTDIHAYNAQAAQQESIIYLLVNGLGSALSEVQPLQQLQLLCDQGATVGIIPLLLQNNTELEDAHLPDFRRQALQNFWQTIVGNAQGLNVINPAQPLHKSATFWSLLQRFDVQLGVGEEACNVWVEQLLERNNKAEAEDSEADFLQIRIGLTGATPAYFSMGERSDAYHALIGGATRTGKTTLLNNLILTACEQYNPEQLQFSLMDFKDGVSFWDYEGLAHITQLYAPVDDDFTQALACLAHFAQQISQRYRQFRTHRVTRLADYNVLASQPLPRCLLVIDEAQSLFEGRDYQQKATVKRLLSTIAKKGAAAGLHMILSTQSFQNVELEGDVKDQFHLRMGLRHASAMGCRALMGRENEAMLHLPRFHAIYNSQQGDDQYNRVVALDDVADFQGRLDALKAHYPQVVVPTDVTIENSTATVKPEIENVERVNPYAAGDVDIEWD